MSKYKIFLLGTWIGGFVALFLPSILKFPWGDVYGVVLACMAMFALVVFFISSTANEYWVHVRAMYIWKGLDAFPHTIGVVYLVLGVVLAPFISLCILGILVCVLYKNLFRILIEIPPK